MTLFLDDKKYLGNDIWVKDEISGDQRCTLFPYWRGTLHKLFPDNLTTAYNTLILTGSIGLGKTEVASIAMLYLLYRMLCLKDPYNYYGLMPNDRITFSLLNITLDTAKGVGWQKIQQHIQNSPWFMEHGSLNASRTNPTWQPDKNIELVFGSSNNQVVGRALFSNFSDEVNFAGGNIKNVDTKKKGLLKLISQIDARMVSRFGKGTFLPTLNIIASSKDTDQSFLDTYIETKRKNSSKTVLVIDEPQWVVRNDKGTPDDPGAFWVAVGGQFLPNELLPVDASQELVDSYAAKGYRMVKVPPIYREHFETNLEQAIMDDAGIASAVSSKFISGARLAQDRKIGHINPFVMDVIEVGNGPDDPMQYANFFDIDKVDIEDKARPMFIHIDPSVSRDKTGISGVWITGKRPDIPGQDSAKSLRYKLAFVVSIKAPRGYEISFEKTRNFIKWLREQGFMIKGISADTSNSRTLLQELQADGFKTELLSVDRVNTNHVCEPYLYLQTTLYERKIEIFENRPNNQLHLANDLLSTELVDLVKKADGHIDHTPEGINSKDSADAFCGAVFTASGYAQEYAFNYGESLDATLDANLSKDVAAEIDKQQLVVSFQDELAKIYMEQFELTAREKQLQNKEQQFYADIADGIIAL